MLSIEFEIPHLPKMINSIGRRHWAVKVRENRLWAERVGHAVLKCISNLLEKNQRLDLPLKKAKLTLIRCSSCEPDFDNLVISFKAVIDALITSQVIISDKPSVVGQPTYLWQRSHPKRGKIFVRIEQEEQL